MIGSWTQRQLLGWKDRIKSLYNLRLSTTQLRNTRSFMVSVLGMLTDIRMNPDNKLSGNIRIINNPFDYPSTWRLILFMNFLCSFLNFYAILQKLCTLIRVYPNILAAGLERTTTGLYFRDFRLSAPPGAIMNLWFYWTFMPLQWNHLPETMPYWYPDIYPDNLLSDKRISG